MKIDEDEGFADDRLAKRQGYSLRGGRMLRSVPDNRSKRVLLIDDDQDISGALQKGFKHEGLSPLEVASDPFEAINMMTEKFYNFIILDWNLPAFNGGETLRKAGQAMAIELDLPNQWDYQRVPVVIFSSSPKEFCIPRKNKHFNYIGFVSKNQPLNQIVDLLNGFIQREVGH